MDASGQAVGSNQTPARRKTVVIGAGLAGLAASEALIGHFGS